MAKASLIEQTKLSYDSEGDVLYISFGDPQPADDSDVTDEGVIVRLRKGRIVGLKSLSGKILIDRSPAIKHKKVKKQASQYHDLDALAGSWTKAEAAMFDKALAKQRTIDTVQSKRN